jgi:hypothetical protein
MTPSKRGFGRKNQEAIRYVPSAKLLAKPMMDRNVSRIHALVRLIARTHIFDVTIEFHHLFAVTAFGLGRSTVIPTSRGAVDERTAELPRQRGPRANETDALDLLQGARGGRGDVRDRTPPLELQP